MKAGRRAVRFGFRLRLQLKKNAEAVQGGGDRGSTKNNDAAAAAVAAAETKKESEADIVRRYAREVAENQKERKEQPEYADLDDEHGDLFSSPWRKAPPNCVWSHRLRCYVPATDPKPELDDGVVVVGALRFTMPQ